jgi:hypothetical protein
MDVGSPLSCSPTLVVVGYLPQCIDPCVDALGLGLGSLPIAPIGAVSYHLIVPNPSALTCQNVKEQLNRYADSVMQILGGGEQVCTPRNKENVGNSPRKRLTA